MANVVTIDSIVRRALAMKRLPLHYYVPYFLHAKRGLEELHFDTLRSFEVVEIPVQANGLIDLPDDFTDLIMLGVIEGDKVRPLLREDKLLQDDNGGVALSVVEVDDYTYNPEDVSPVYDLIYKGRTFERGLVWKDGYTLIRDQGVIRLDNRSTITTVVMKYLTTPRSVGLKSVIHPYAQQTLLDWIEWQESKYRPLNRFDPQIKSRDYYNSLRILKGRMSDLTFNDLIQSARKGSN